TGIGIPSQKQRDIFRPFVQADGSTTRRYGGTGLGLAISSQLVAMMGGRIWVESEAGKGSTFHFTAPFALPQSSEARPAPMRVVNIRDLPVLVVDDNATNRRILEEMLTKWEMRPTLADGGEAALAAMERAHAAGNPFPLVLTDAQMPGMDGFTLAERIRRNHQLAGAMIMMLTSVSLGSDAARCRELGVAAYLTKPIKQSELLDAILRVLGQPLQDHERAALVADYSLRENSRLHILVAEDNPVNQKIAARLLRKRGYEVVVASDGKEALAALEKQRFDLVFMDVQMPHMDGFEATAAIREEEKATGAHVRIVAMTAHAMTGDRERCLQAGMDDYVAKPIRAEELYKAIDYLVPVPAETGSAP
ncbi:MAG: response regulator, partial [Acidobacteria bacterium]|nr:response regulator [Acidobacteriota bacterium]